MSDNKKKRIGKIFVPQKPSKVPGKSIEFDKGLVPPNTSKPPPMKYPDKGLVPPNTPKPPPIK